MSKTNKKSLYDVLGVTKTDSTKAIKKAYFKLAVIHHPDKGGDPEVFKEITKAHEILSDDGKRRMYDEFGITDDNQSMTHESPFGPGPGGFQFPFEVNLSDLFGGMFGSGGQRSGFTRKGKKPTPVSQSLNATLEQFYLGHNIDVHINRQSFCKDCDQSGAKSKETCRQCGGAGSITQIVQMGPMTMHTNGPCMGCQGKGVVVLETCKTCIGTGFTNEKRHLVIKILPGMKPSETFIFPEVCSDHPAFESPGDAHITVNEDANDPAFKLFKRSGTDLRHLEITVSLSLSESLCGCVIQISSHPGFDDGLFVKIPGGSFHGDKYCLTGFGMPVQGNLAKYGDLFILIEVAVKQAERELFIAKGQELLTPIFRDGVRRTECVETAVISDVYLRK
jgi:DnaJ family protein A protein 2